MDQEFTDLADSELRYTVFHADSYGVFRFSQQWITVAPPTFKIFFCLLAGEKRHNFRMMSRIEPKLGRY